MTADLMGDDEVLRCFKKATEACRLFPYGVEEEFQWHMAFLLAQATPMSITREQRTQCNYYTDEVTSLLVRADNPVRGHRRSPGYLDIVCSRDRDKWMIELKYPRSKKQAQYYGIGLRRDLQKLQDASDATRLYELCLIREENYDAFNSEMLECEKERLLEGVCYCIGTY